MRLKHVRNRGNRRVRQGRWGLKELRQMTDRQLLDTPGVRKGIRSVRARCWPELFIALQHKYPWPKEWKKWDAHSVMLNQRMTNLRKIHHAYRGMK